jgi:hypothetical protein
MPFGLGANWGAAARERSREFPCDRLCARSGAACFRAVTVEAGAGTVFRWLCQLRVAPYAYDWIDSWGRRRPPQLSADLEPGQTLMTIFRLVAFESGRSLTAVTRNTRSARGEVWDSYLVLPLREGACRRLVKLLVRYPSGPGGWLLRAVLPPGDLLMMRRQLLNLKSLAERDFARGAGSSRGWAPSRPVAPGLRRRPAPLGEARHPRRD